MDVDGVGHRLNLDPCHVAELYRRQFEFNAVAMNLLEAWLALSLAKTSSTRSGAPRCVNPSTGPRPRAWLEVGRPASLGPSALHGHTGVAMEDGERAGWAAELDL